MREPEGGKKCLTYSHMGMYCLPMARAATTSDAFNPVAEPRRRAILNYLALQERPVGEIVDSLGLEQPSVSKHLRVLLEVGLVNVRRDGRRMLYRTNAEAIRPLLGSGAGHQAADVARDYGAVVHVLSGRVESAVPLERDRWRNTERFSSHGAWTDYGRPPKRSRGGLAAYPRRRSEAGGGAAFAVNGDAVGVVPAAGGNYVSILHRQRSAAGRKVDVGGRFC